MQLTLNIEQQIYLCSELRNKFENKTYESLFLEIRAFNSEIHPLKLSQMFKHAFNAPLKECHTQAVQLLNKYKNA